MLVTTTNDLPGVSRGAAYRRGARPDRAFAQRGRQYRRRDPVALRRQISRLYTHLAETARQEAYDLLLQHAQQAGANAIIGMRYDANEIMDGITEVLAYGTAVVVEQA